MGKVKLGLQKMSITGKLGLATLIVTQMTGNPNFVTPVPSLADLTADKDNLKNAYNEALALRLRAKAATELMADMEKKLDQTLARMALYVENVSGGNDGKILSAGMGVKDTGAPIGQLAAPTDLSAMAGNDDGEIDLNWEPVYGSKSYLVEMTLDPNAPNTWKHKTSVTESFAVIKELASGTKYWFRVAAVGAAGQGPFSDPAAKYAP
ncbi:MAG: fibronectin type III domain-containing protein [Planctomycetota bacterium]